MTRREMESRRIKAAVLFSLDWIPSAVARELGVSRMSACRWRDTWQDGQDMRARRSTGRPPRLSRERYDQVAALYRESGKPSTQRFAEILFERFGVTYTRDHVGKLLRKLRFDPRRAQQERCRKVVVMKPQVQQDEAIAS